jgi:hypothetical protein
MVLNIIQGFLVCGLATELILIAILCHPLIARLRLRPPAENAFLAIFVSLGVYLMWIGQNFFTGSLGPPNGDFSLVVIRIWAFVSATWFLGTVIRIRRNPANKAAHPD